jgi:hypothetical protein
LNRSELRERILHLVNESIASPIFYTSAQVNSVIQEALEIISEEITTLRKQAFLVTEPGRHWYTTYEISETCISPFRIWSDATSQRLIPLTFDEVDDHYTQWQAVSSDAPQWWYPVSFDMFGIWPGPSSGGQLLRVDYVAWPDALDHDADEPIIREIEQDLLILYGQYDGMLRQWETARAMELFNRFSLAYRDSQYKTSVRRYYRTNFDRSTQEEHHGYPG